MTKFIGYDIIVLTTREKFYNMTDIKGFDILYVPNGVILFKYDNW